MLRVPIAYAKPGMVLAVPIYHPRRTDTVLLSEGMTLDAHSITRLAEIQRSQLNSPNDQMSTLVSVKQ